MHNKSSKILIDTPLQSWRLNALSVRGDAEWSMQWAQNEIQLLENSAAALKTPFIRKSSPGKNTYRYELMGGFVREQHEKGVNGTGKLR